MQLISAETFAPLVSTVFKLKLGEASVDLTLVEMSRPAVRPYRGQLREPFSLFFRSSSQVVLPQRAYPLDHAGLGRLDIFIVPVARDPQGVVYQAVFN